MSRPGAAPPAARSARGGPPFGLRRALPEHLVAEFLTVAVHTVDTAENFSLKTWSACERSCCSNERQYVTIAMWASAGCTPPSEPSCDAKPENFHTCPPQKPPLSSP